MSKSKITAANWSALTRFERARIIGARALQISAGAPAIVHPYSSSIRTAEEELRRGLLPITIRRRLPNGYYQDIPLNSLCSATQKL